MPFDNPLQPPQRPRKRRIPLPRTTLKSVIMDAYFAGLISARDAEDMIAEFGLRSA